VDEKSLIKAIKKRSTKR